MMISRELNKCQFITCGVVGAILAVGGTILLGVWWDLFAYIMNKQLPLSPTSHSYEMWKDVPVPMYLEFYLWNWTNPGDIENSDPEIRKPNLVEMGPYVFSQKKEKIPLEWDPTNGTVTFLQKKTWFFEPELSGGSLDDHVTMLNVPAVAAVYAIRKDDTWKFPLEMALNWFDVSLSVTKKAREILFEGYYNILMDIGNLLGDGALPVTIPFDKFGWFYTRNGSEKYEGVFTMFTGADDLDKFGKIHLWNYENPTSKYESYCGLLNGSAGEFFPPTTKYSDPLVFFSPDICRSIHMKYSEPVEVAGIKGYRYLSDQETLSTGDDTCFCPSGECPPSGALDVSTCKWNTPSYISFPHFLDGDPSYREAVRGMKPDPEEHKMFIDLEQNGRVPLRVRAALQINMLLQPYPEYNLFRNVPKVYFPTLWFKERATIGEDVAFKVRLVNLVPAIGYGVLGALTCAGIVMLVIVGVSLVNLPNRKVLTYEASSLMHY